MTLLSSSLLHGQDSSLFSSSNSEKYAEHLFSTGDYKTAFAEYKRLTFLNPERIEFKTKSLVSAYLSAQFIEGINQARTYYPSDSLFPHVVAKQYVHLLFKVDAPIRTETFLIANNHLGLKDKFFYRTANKMLSSQMSEAARLLENTEFDFQPIRNLKTILIQENQFKPKSTALAGVMSAVVPGSGKVYAGEWKDGLLSFVYVSLSGFQSYRGFRERGVESVYGWIFGAIATGFYSGNIYGSVRSIHRRRNKHRAQINQQITHAIESHY